MLWKQGNFTTAMKFRVKLYFVQETKTTFNGFNFILIFITYLIVRYNLLIQVILQINEKLTNTTAATASPILLHVSLQMALNGTPLLSFQ